MISCKFRGQRSKCCLHPQPTHTRLFTLHVLIAQIRSVMSSLTSSSEEDRWEEEMTKKVNPTKQTTLTEKTSKKKHDKKKKKKKAKNSKKQNAKTAKEELHTTKFKAQQQAASTAGKKTTSGKRGVRSGTVRMTQSQLWVAEKWYHTQVRQEKELDRLLMSAGMDPTSPVTWQFIPVLSKPPAMKTKHNPGFWSRRVKCPLCVESLCPVEYKIVYDPKREHQGLPAYGIYTRQDTLGNCLLEHSHDGFHLRRQCPRVIQQQMTAERLMRDTPLSFIRNLGIWDSTKDLRIQGEFDREWSPGCGKPYCVARSQIVNCWNRKKKKLEQSTATIEISAEDVNTYAELQQRIKPFLKEPDHDHDPYCIGYWLDSRDGLKIIIIIVSTKHMLMNMWLNDTVPGCVHNMCMDDTYKTNKAGFPLNVFGGVDIAQQFRNYCFSITNKETTYAYQYILRTAMDAAMKVVKEKKRSTTPKQPSTKTRTVSYSIEF